MAIFHSCSIPWLPQLYWSISQCLPYLFFRTRKWQFSLFMEEEQGHRTQRIWTVKVNTEAHIVCSVNYCSNHCSALPLSTGGGTYSYNSETGLISLVFIPGFCNMNTAEARTGIYLKVSPEMPSFPEESGGNKLCGITYSIFLLPLCWKGLYGSLRPDFSISAPLHPAAFPFVMRNKPSLSLTETGTTARHVRPVL